MATGVHALAILELLHCAVLAESAEVDAMLFSSSAGAAVLKFATKNAQSRCLLRNAAADVISALQQRESVVLLQMMQSLSPQIAAQQGALGARLSQSLDAPSLMQQIGFVAPKADEQQQQVRGPCCRLLLRTRCAGSARANDAYAAMVPRSPSSPSSTCSCS